MSTPNYGLPFPVQSDIPDVAADLQELAEATDAALTEVDGKRGGLVMRGNNEQVALSATTDSAPITIGYTYPDSLYTVLLTITAGNSVQVLKPQTRTTTTFTVRGYDASGAQVAGTVRVNWLTIGPEA